MTETQQLQVAKEALENIIEIINRDAYPGPVYVKRIASQALSVLASKPDEPEIAGNTKWLPETDENKFVNNLWESFSDTPFADVRGTPDVYSISFERMDCFFRNIFRSTQPSTKTEPGMKWVKASERFPDDWIDKIFRDLSTREIYSEHSIKNAEPQEFILEDGRIIEYKTLEWLEETPPIDRDDESVLSNHLKNLNQ